MPRARSIPLCLVFLAPILAVQTQAASDPPWLQINSAHFTVITDAGDKRGREVALRFEQMRTVFATLLAKERMHQSVPLTILALQNDKAYYQVAPLHQGQPIDVPGFFLPGDDQDFIALNLSEQASWRAVVHDFAFMFLSYNYPPAQGWFDEGLCEYFSSIRLDNTQGELGSDPGLLPAVKDLLANPHAGPLPTSLTELLSARQWMSIPELFAMKPAPETRNQSGNEATRTLFYAQSWIVMHYLVHQKKMPETGAYLGLVLAQNVPIDDAIKQAYGMNSAQLDQAVKEYFRSQIAPPADAARNPPNPANSGPLDRFPSPVATDSTITAKAMPESDARAIYAGVQIRIPERREMGLKTLQELAATPTEADKKADVKATKRTGEDADQQLPSNAEGNAIAHRLLAWDHIQHGEFQEAFTEMGDAAGLNPSDMWVRYYLSLAKYRMAQAKHTEMFGIANMMFDLKAVLEWNPDMAGAYDLLALARNAGGSPTPAMQSERAAMNLSPREQRYPLHLAEIYVTSKKWEAAGALLERLKNSDSPQIAAQASELLEQANSQRKYGIPGTSASASQPKYQPQKTPFDVLDEDAAKRAAAENGDQSGTPLNPRSMKFANGRLVTVDCSQPPAAVLTVSSESGTLKLRIADYKSMVLIGADGFSCDWRDRRVTVNYKPGRGTEGDLVSLEMR